MLETEDYRQLAHRSPDGIMIVRDALLLFVNDAAARLLDTPVETLLGTPFLERVHRDDRAVIADRLAELTVTSPPLRLDAQLLRRDGTSVRVDLAAACLDDRRSCHITCRDITARELREAALRESEERLTLAFAGAREGVWDWNLETDAVFYSQRWKQMLGYEEHEIEPHVHAWQRLVHPDDRRRADAAHDGVACGEPTYEAELRLRHRAGHYVHVLSRGFPIRRPGDGQVVRIVGTHLDLTDRKQAEAALRESEERLRLAFAGAQEGVYDWDLETGQVIYSSRWKEMLGYAEEEIEGHVSAWERLLHPSDQIRAAEAVERVMAGDPSYHGEFRLRHKNGDYVHVLSRGYPVRRDSGGPVVRIVGTHFDLTERKRTEEQLRRTQEELERRVQERTAELARVNESLRAEMIEHAHAERARTELLSRLLFAQEDERRRIAREMHDQFGEQLTRLARRIEVFAARAQADPSLEPDVAALAEVAEQLDRDVDHLVWELRPTALDDLGLRAALANYVQDWSQRLGISAALHTSGLLDERLPPDAETTFYRIAQEALTNVAKHARARNVDVILERRDGYVLLVVEDDGVGFDAGARGGPGQGFGLHGMQERAALVGATIAVESAAGKGTTVLVRMMEGAANTEVAERA